MTETTTSQRRTLPWKIVFLGVIALALALIIGTQVIGVLYSIIAPPSPPLPPSVTELSHSSTDYGVDNWLYGTDQDACEILKFYQDQGATCFSMIENCTTSASGEETQSSGTTGPQHIAQCNGQKQFSIFAMRWELYLSTGYQKDGVTHFGLDREIFWTGAVPPKPEY